MFQWLLGSTLIGIGFLYITYGVLEITKHHQVDLKEVQQERIDDKQAK